MFFVKPLSISVHKSCTKVSSVPISGRSCSHICRINFVVSNCSHSFVSSLLELLHSSWLLSSPSNLLPGLSLNVKLLATVLQMFMCDVDKGLQVVFTWDGVSLEYVCWSTSDLSLITCGPRYSTAPCCMPWSFNHWCAIFDSINAWKSVCMFYDSLTQSLSKSFIIEDTDWSILHIWYNGYSFINMDL